ncbi:MAG TPA: family 20 glycosylhydrolase, partial [Tahibacter sp.]|nr:family 20 glycosylhydrolase [Tahibacter sp.]
MKSASIVAAFLIACLAACSPTPQPTPPAPKIAAAKPALVPQPLRLDVRDGALRIDASTRVVAASPEAKAAAAYFVDTLKRTRDVALTVVDADAQGAIVFTLDPAAPDDGDEGYAIAIDARGAKVTARTARGLFYGGVSLWQLATSGNAGEPVVLPALSIQDRPRYAWRGLMLDSARHFQSTAFVKRTIDQMAQHKLNVLHWHLTDDQGWRIEIKKYPKLTDVGAWRVPPGPAAAADVDPATGKPRVYGGFYTQDEIRDVVRYAAERHVDIVPEIDMPGHAQAAIAAYPELGTGDTPGVSLDWGVHTYLLNVEDSTFAFVENVLDEVIPLFPFRYVHVGGDEAVKDRWQASAQVQAKMKALGVKDETALQGWFLERVEAMLEKHDRKLIGWDEILESKLPAEATVMSWRGTAGAVEAARHGHDVVLSPAPQLYINNLQSLAGDEPPGRLDALVTLESVYGFEPTPPELSADEARHVLGAQVNLWTEHMRTDAMVEHAIYPRLAAIAEVGWSPAAARDWRGFVARLPAQFARYRAAGIGYADSAFRVQASVDGTTVTLASQVKDAPIRYTLDGSEPTAQSGAYTAPFDAGNATAVRAAAFVDGVRMAEARPIALDADAQRTRDSAQLKPCRDNGLILRLEDDAPVAGPRPVYTVDIFDACWLWPQAPLDGVARIAAEVGNLPYNFQLWRDIKNVVVRKPANADGELVVLLDGCDGKPWATIPLTAAKANA